MKNLKFKKDVYGFIYNSNFNYIKEIIKEKNKIINLNENEEIFNDVDIIKEMWELNNKDDVFNFNKDYEFEIFEIN